MFHVISPKQGDLIVDVPLGISTAANFRVGIYHGIFGSDESLGLAPFEWGGDRFNNKNCRHLNFEGTLIKTSGITNVAAIAGPSFITTYGSTTKVSLYRQLSVEGYPYNFLLRKKENLDYSFQYYTVSRNVWTRYEHRITVDWIDYYRFRTVYRHRTIRHVTGEVLYQTSYCTYHTYTSTFSNVRRFTIEVASFSKEYTKWIEPPLTPSYVSTRRTLIGPGDSTTITPEYLYSRSKKLLNFIQTYDSSSYGQLSIDAVQALKVFDGQLSLLLRDIIGFKETILSFMKGIGSLTIRGLSSGYLSYRYGLKLTYNDIKKLAGSARSAVDGKRGFNTSRSRLQRTIYFEDIPSLPVNIQYNMKLYVRDYPDWVIDFLQQMMVADFFPTLELVWDIIPFSFVVDWFIPIGDYAEMLDSNTLLSTYKVLSCITSRRATIEGEFSVIYPEFAGKVFGVFRVTDYVRHISSTPPPFGLDFTTPRSFNHWLEGSALIAQRSRV